MDLKIVIIAAIFILLIGFQITFNRILLELKNISKKLDIIYYKDIDKIK